MCSSPAQLANQETQRVRAVLALRAERRWVLTPRAARGSAAGWRAPWLRGLLIAVRGSADDSDGAPGWRAQAELLLFEGAEGADEDESEDDGDDDIEDGEEWEGAD